MMYKRREELFNTMQSIVDTNVKTYRTDFDIDKKILSERDNETFVWIVREHGTHLIQITNSIDPLYYIHVICDNYDIYTMYIVTTIVNACYMDEVTLPEIEEIISERDALTIHIVDAPFEEIEYSKQIDNCYFDNDDKLHEWAEKYIGFYFTHFKGYYYVTQEGVNGIITDGYVSC